MSFKGVDVRQTTDRLIFRAFLQDANGNKITSGTTNYYLYELQSDGTLKSYDFNDNTFKTTALTTETAALTHRTGNNATTNTGLWTANLTTLTGFTVGNIYFILVNNSLAVSPWQAREFQFGSDQGDLTTTSAGLLKVEADDYASGKTPSDYSGLKINTALNNFEFYLRSAANPNLPATGQSVTATRSIDGSAFTFCTNTATEVSGGYYVINLSAADLNGKVISFLFSAGGAVTTAITVITTP